MSKIHTLLEAAHFLEMQERKQKEAEHQAAVEAAINAQKTQIFASPVSSTQNSPPTIHITQTNKSTNGQQRVLITSTIDSTVFQQVSKANSVNIGTPVLIKNEKPEQQSHVSSTVNSTNQGGVHGSHGRILHNSFDIMNPLVIDETNPDVKRKHPPMVFRSGTREVHNKLEKHRRAHLKECFDILKKQLPQSQDEKKTSNLSILHSALRYIHLLKRTERELEHEMERLAREKIASQQKLAVLKKEISVHCDFDISKLITDTETIPITTTTQSGSSQITILSDVEMKDDLEIKYDPVSSSNSPTGNNDRLTIPVLTTSKNSISVTTNGQIKEVAQQPVQTALSVLPVTYPVSQGLVLQKLAIVPKGLTDLPLMSTHFITPQQLNGKVVPIVNQYVVKPVVVVSTASPRPS